MPDENALRIKAREALRTGKLPHARPSRMWGGPGVGASCTVCSDPVRQEDLGFELEFGSEHAGPFEGNHHVHLRCFAAWEFERRTSESARGTENGSNGAQSHPSMSEDNYSRQRYESTATHRGLPEHHNLGTISVCNEPTDSAGERDTLSRGGAP